MATIERPRTVARRLLSLNIIKFFTIQPNPSHFQILRCLPDNSMKHQTSDRPIEDTHVHEVAFIRQNGDDNRLELSNLTFYFHFINEIHLLHQKAILSECLPGQVLV